MKEVSVRPIKPTDLEAIVAIDKMVLGRERSEYWDMKMELVRERTAMGGLVAEVEGKVVGFILGEASGWEYGVPDTTGYIDTIDVDPGYQGHGVATVLLRELITHLKKVGVEKMATYVNWRAGDLLHFFSQAGFQPGDMISLQLRV